MVAVIWGIFVLKVFLIVIPKRGRENSGTHQSGEVRNGVPYLKEKVIVVVKPPLEVGLAKGSEAGGDHGVVTVDRDREFVNRWNRDLVLGVKYKCLKCDAGTEKAGCIHPMVLGVASVVTGASSALNCG